MDAKQLQHYIIEPVLQEYSSISRSFKKIYSASAVKLVLMTAAVESDMGRYIIQNNKRMDEEKKAVSIYQLERPTIDFVAKRASRNSYLMRLFSDDLPEKSIYNLKIATLLCRLVYWYKTKDPIPHLTDTEGLWKYYKKWYNSSLGATTREEFLRRCKKHKII